MTRREPFNKEQSVLRSNAMTMHPARSASQHDTTVYPVEDKMGEDLLQRQIMEVLRPMVREWFKTRGVVALVGADQFVYFRIGDTRGRLAPDLFVLPGVKPGRRIKSWKVWQEGIAPSFALEVVSGDVDKDYVDGPPLYRELGVRELVIFDPDSLTESDDERVLFQVYRRVARRGLVKMLVTNEDRVVSRELGCHLRVEGSGDQILLRLATGPHGENWVPTGEERERAEKERERAEKERERAEKERERAEKERERGEKELDCAEKLRERAEKEFECAEKLRERDTRVELEKRLLALTAELELMREKPRAGG